MRLNAWRLCTAPLRAQGLATVLTLALLALGVGTIVCALLLGHAMEERLVRDARGIDAVVGAKGSPMQLVLSSVLHLDVPTGNIARSEARRIAAHPLVATTYPLALGDAHAGARIVGTAWAYAEHYRARLAAGRRWERPMEAVLGSAVAARTGLGVGDRFAGSHGLGFALARHDERPFEVVGVLSSSGSVLDRLILTDVESVWEVHEPPGSSHDPASREITALLVRYRSPAAMMTFPRQVNRSGQLQVASPAIELNRLLGFVGIGIDVFTAFAAVLLLTAGLSLFVSLYRALHDQRHDLVLMRVLGARPRRLFGHVLGQGMLLGLVGSVAGVAIGHLAASGVAWWLREARAVPIELADVLGAELAVVGAALLIAAAASVVPAWRAYRMDAALAMGHE